MRENQHLFHVIWTTFGEFPVWDKRGNWNDLVAQYRKLSECEIHYQLSRALHARYENKAQEPSIVFLDRPAQEQLKQDLHNLTHGGDRIVQNLELVVSDISETTVQLLVFSDFASLNQKISRLKSRTATLLSFGFPEACQGKKTWGKGYWRADIHNKNERALSIISGNFGK
jgi:hypothetical protein